MLLLYQILIFFISLLIWPFFLLSKRGRYALLERYGFWPKLDQSSDWIWIHSASLGEFSGMVPIIPELRKIMPNVRVLVTATSASVLELANSQIAAGQIDQIRLLPFDTAPYYKLAFGSIVPRLVLIAETELWPGMLSFSSQHGTKIVWINARISEYTFTRYAFFKKFLSNCLQKVNLLLASTEEAKERFLKLGMPIQKIKVIGNTKYDKEPGIKLAQEREKFHREFFNNALPVLVLGSLRPEEEKFWFKAFSQDLDLIKKINIVIAPRHQEKFDYFAQKLKDFGLDFQKRSLKPTPEISNQGKIILLDTLGELEQVYSFANLAFIGGSLLEQYGGHNPLEPAAYGAALLMGPYRSNVELLALQLEQRQALNTVSTTEDIFLVIKELSDSSQNFHKKGKVAQDFWQEQRGALGRALKEIEQVMQSGVKDA